MTVWREHGPMRAAVLGVPWLWLSAFILLPFSIVVAISLSVATDSQPPYAFGPVLDSYRLIVEDTLYLAALGNAIRIAATSSFVCLLIGYPMAYAIARAQARWRGLLLALVILPFWTSFLIRIYAWMTLLRPTGLINQVLIDLGIIGAPLQLMNNAFAVHLGIIYAYLPFMILPLYASIERLDPNLLEAAADLGSRPWRRFLSVTLPLTLSGVVAGMLLVFVPAVGEFVIPELLGGPDTPMIGRLLWIEFFNNRDWPVAASIAVALTALLVVPVAILQHMLAPREGAREVGP
ncbi:MAG TPA: ABC transporter permease subunit [Alphaproteobacteria bacterium]